jgi:predicted histidine transporter YuiF (NhaC family)
MPPVTVATVVKLLVWSLVVGAVLAFLNLTPQEVFGWVAGTLEGLVDNLQHYTGRAISYLLLGAVIVVPIWALNYLWRAFKGRS